MPHSTTVDLIDLAGAEGDMLDDVIHGLRSEVRTLPCKLLYDEKGSQLFDRICELPEYYPTRTELAIMDENIEDICRKLGPQVLLIELGSGSSMKTRYLLDEMHDPVAYVPIDISRSHLLDSAGRINARYPSLEVLPVCADYIQPLQIPVPTREARRRVIYFPGSTIGNFHPHEARRFLRRLAGLAGPGGGLLIGVDLRKDPDLLIAAYDDAQGVTAAFNRNLLYRLRHELSAELAPEGFAHEARWNEQCSRIEMHLISRERQQIIVAGETFTFAPGESIWTESSYKHTLEGFADLADAFTVRNVWMDANEWFSVQYLEV